MKVTNETDIYSLTKNEKFWCEAQKNAEKLTPSEMDQLTKLVEKIYPEGIDMISLNYWLSHKFEKILEYLGLNEDELGQIIREQ